MKWSREILWMMPLCCLSLYLYSFCLPFSLLSFSFGSQSLKWIFPTTASSQNVEASPNSTSTPLAPLGSRPNYTCFHVFLETDCRRVRWVGGVLSDCPGAACSWTSVWRGPSHRSRITRLNSTCLSLLQRNLSSHTRENTTRNRRKYEREKKITSGPLRGKK